MSRNTCSQCGQVGHNKRNRKCSVNVQRESVFVEITPETRMRAKKCRDNLMFALGTLISLSRYFEEFQNQHTDASQFTLTCVTKFNLFCEQINLALEYDVLERPIIRPQHILSNLLERVESFNSIFAVLVNSSFRLNTNYEEHTRKFTVSFINDESVYIKNTTDYLKDIVLTQDLTVENMPLCDCPLCFDLFDASSVLITNCKHSFCAPCIKGYTTAIKDNTKKPNCPMCRTDITEFKIRKIDIYEEIHTHLLNL